MTKIFDAYMERVTAPVIAEGHIRQICSKIYPLAKGYGRLPYSDRLRWKINLDEGQASDIVEALQSREDGGPLVTEAQWRKGSDWLRNYGRRLGLPESIYTVDPAEFRFSHCDAFLSGYWPVWRPWYVAYYNDGRTLGYFAVPWQSGKTEFEYTIGTWTVPWEVTA